MDTEILSAWLNKPGQVPVSLPTYDVEEEDASRIVSEPDRSLSTSNHSQQGVTIEAERYVSTSPSHVSRDNVESASSPTMSHDLVDNDKSAYQRGLSIIMPRLTENQKKGYTYLSGHFLVERVLSKREDGKYVIRLQSGETELAAHSRLRDLANGRESLRIYEETKTRPGRRSHRPSAVPNMVDWTTLNISDSDSEEEQSQINRRKRRKSSVDSQHDSKDDANDDDLSEDQEPESSEESQTLGRRSSRLARSRKRVQYLTELDELGIPDEDTGRRSRRLVGRAQRNLPNNIKDRTDMDGARAARRSERTRILPRRNMRERQEDEISSASEDEVGPKIVSTKEHFLKISEHDPFRKRHRNQCDTCSYTGDIAEKGPLVFCQGCTNAYHKSCLGFRGTREHLVTKVDDGLFVLQCRRCIGVVHDKDHLAPHLGHCSATDCEKPGPVSKPFRHRLTTRQEQLQREENGGKDPITVVNADLINNTSNVMFRCATCQRAWHMHHLPERKIMHLQDDGDHDLDEEQLAQKRFDLYHRSWTCKDCVENQNQIDVIVAWRPQNVDTYIPGTPVDMMPVSQIEYLIKWKGQSYIRVSWMPAAWVWGIVAGIMRLAFMKKPENAMPKFTTKDAIPEDFFHVDIVFDVRYTSVVRNSSKGIDMVRAKEVDTAFVKYKGLGYEDAIWEKPPEYTDVERWNDFKAAYEDYVTKVYMGNPVRSTLSRHLASIRAQNFEKLVKHTQPGILTGGQLMQYQLEGLNWLYWQWFQSHNAILADEMGLGKTIQLVAFFATMVQEHKCWPFLVVVPNSTCPNWRREIKKWAPSLRVVMYYGSEKARKLTHDYELFPKDKEPQDEKHSTKKSKSEAKDMRAHIVVASYESVVEEKTRSLMRVPWQGLIVDEGQRLKNDKNLVYDSLSKFNFPFKALLTGTPLQNNPRELFNLLQFLDKSKNAAELEAKYAELTEENIPELHELLRPFFLRRTKVQVLTFLPPMAQIIIPVTMSTVQKRVAKSILSQNPNLMKSIFSRDPLGQKDRFNLNNILMQLRKTLCHPYVYSREIEERTNDQDVAHRGLVEASAKLQLLQIMLPKLKERGHRVLMFSQFLDNLDIMEDFLDGLGLLHRRLDGTINALEKQKRIDEYNAPDSPYFAFLLSTRAGGVGINLATADTVLILDPDFNPHQDIQALSRAHRIGQKNKVLVFQLMTKDSAEEKIMAIGRKKMALDHVLIERMDQEDDAGENLESILRFGANTLFEGHTEDDIVYDSASVDKLLDRSQIESTKTSEDKSAESQFSFARVWANDKGSLEDGVQDVSEDTQAPNPDLWDKILQERELAYQAEQARKAETLGRGKRRRGQVDYRTNDRDIEKTGQASGDKDSDASDAEFTENEGDYNDGLVQSSSSAEDSSEAEQPRRTIKARPFKRVKVPLGPAPHFNGDGPNNYVPIGDLPRSHQCSACKEYHPMGWCRLKIAGVEHCGLCGLAHTGHGRTCPHLNNEKQVEVLLAALRESTEPREIVEEATKYLRLIRSDLVGRRKAKERKEEEARVKALAAQAAVTMRTGMLPLSFAANGNGNGNGSRQDHGHRNGHRYTDEMTVRMGQFRASVDSIIRAQQAHGTPPSTRFPRPIFRSFADDQRDARPASYKHDSSDGDLHRGANV